MSDVVEQVAFISVIPSARFEPTTGHTGGPLFGGGPAVSTQIETWRPAGARRGSRRETHAASGIREDCVVAEVHPEPTPGEMAWRPLGFSLARILAHERRELWSLTAGEMGRGRINRFVIRHPTRLHSQGPHAGAESLEGTDSVD